LGARSINWAKLTAMIILHSHLQPQFIYELFHINFTSFHSSLVKTGGLNEFPILNFKLLFKKMPTYKHDSLDANYHYKFSQQAVFGNVIVYIFSH